MVSRLSYLLAIRSLGLSPFKHIPVSVGVVARGDLSHIRPNQSMEPTATAVTPRADARVAPAAAVAHH